MQYYVETWLITAVMYICVLFETKKKKRSKKKNKIIVVSMKEVLIIYLLEQPDSPIINKLGWKCSLTSVT